MNHLFISHTPYLLDEFFLCENRWSHPERTPQRTNLFLQILESLGPFKRINPTLWLLSTECSASETLDRIRCRLKESVDLETCGDIFVICSNGFAATSSLETGDLLRSIFPTLTCDNSESLKAPTPSNTNKPTVQLKSAKRDMREEISEEYSIKPTDAMFWRMPGSFGHGKRR